MIITTKILIYSTIHYYFFQTYWLNLPDFYLMQLDSFFSM